MLLHDYFRLFQSWMEMTFSKDPQMTQMHSPNAIAQMHGPKVICDHYVEKN